ncbi:hypothetical protein [Catenulispora pinisilvae]|uniref:hypothetical protein n=1 Tax=Catenulispora pinisilvae TaxID=2705253 RepID=UPI001890CA18|nr:hypothetical protein [Catenulispora pinisilvae]
MRGSQGSSSASERLIWNPAGSDRDLATACQDLAAGRFRPAKDLLAATGRQWDLRCYRMLLLAQAAAPSAAVERWRSEEPDNLDAVLLQARTAVIRAIRSQREKHHSTPALVELAEKSCLEAAQYAPGDPTPWVARLQLHVRAPEETTPRELMAEVRRRDPWNREGFHRLLAAIGSAAGGAVSDVFDMARWASSNAPAGSPMHVLPLVAYVDGFQRESGDSARARLINGDRQWAAVHARLDIERAYQSWFASKARAGPTLLPDLHLMAHALWKGGYFTDAKPVFEEIGRYALTMPWSLHGQAAEVFSRARERCMRAPAPPSP